MPTVCKRFVKSWNGSPIVKNASRTPPVQITLVDPFRNDKDSSVKDINHKTYIMKPSLIATLLQNPTAEILGLAREYIAGLRTNSPSRWAALRLCAEALERLAGVQDQGESMVEVGVALRRMALAGKL